MTLYTASFSSSYLHQRSQRPGFGAGLRNKSYLLSSTPSVVVRRRTAGAKHEWLKQLHTNGLYEGSSQITIERFTGERGDRSYAHVWIATIEEVAEMSNWSADTCLKVARLRLGGHARLWLDGLSNSRAGDWESFKQAFLERFGERKESILANWLTAFSSRVNQLWSMLIASAASHAEQGEVTTTRWPISFIKGLRPFLRKQVVLQRLYECGSGCGRREPYR
jgi:hypothetical protein